MSRRISRIGPTAGRARLGGPAAPVLAVTALLLILTAAAWPPDIQSADCNSNTIDGIDPFTQHRVFVTSGTTDGNIGGAIITFDNGKPLDKTDDGEINGAILIPRN